jgi:hypothetical protein
VCEYVNFFKKNLEKREGDAQSTRQVTTASRMQVGKRQ